jgi:4-hydroxy-2-oxoglutarate aldolase
VGCAGGVLAFANAVPQTVVGIWEAHRTREFDAAMDWQRRILRAAQLVTTKYGVPGLKHAMDINGYYGGPPRLPLTAIGPEAKQEIEQAFHGLEG